MKVLAVLSAVLAVAACQPTVDTWTLSGLTKAIETKSHPDMMPYLEDGLNQIMQALYSGTNLKLYQIRIPSPSGATTWTADELNLAIEDDKVSTEYKNAVFEAQGYLKQRQEAGELQDTVEVVVPAIDVSFWTTDDLKMALDDARTKPELIPYLKKASDEIQQAYGKPEKTVGVVTPIGYIPHKINYQYIPKFKKY